MTDKKCTDKPTIIQIGKYYSPVTGGIENNVRQLAQASADQFNSIALCMNKGRGPRQQFSDGSVEVTLLKSYGAIWRQEIVTGCCEVLREYQPDIVHFHTPNPLLAFQVWSYVRSSDCSLVVSHHADLQRPALIRKFANAATNKLLDRADKIVSYTKTFAESCLELRPHLEKLVLLPHGISLPPQGIPEPRTSIQNETLRIGFLGRLEKWKGLDVLLDVLTIEKDLSLIVGGHGGYFDELNKKVDDLNLRKRVDLLGSVAGEEKETFFRSIDALVLPSLNTGESYGQVLVEAQLRGLPVVASNLPTGIREICRFGKTGLLFKPGSANELISCLHELRDSQTYSHLAREGQLSAIENFSEPTVSTRIPAFYRDLIEQKER